MARRYVRIKMVVCKNKQLDVTCLHIYICGNGNEREASKLSFNNQRTRKTKNILWQLFLRDTVMGSLWWSATVVQAFEVRWKLRNLQIRTLSANSWPLISKIDLNLTLDSLMSIKWISQMSILDWILFDFPWSKISLPKSIKLVLISDSKLSLILCLQTKNLNNL